MREDYRSLFLDGKDMAMAFDCKFIDTSCVLKHNVDELLVGTAKQILLRRAQDAGGSCEKVWNLIEIFSVQIISGKRNPILLLQDVDQSPRSVDEYVQEVVQQGAQVL